MSAFGCARNVGCVALAMVLSLCCGGTVAAAGEIVPGRPVTQFGGKGWAILGSHYPDATATGLVRRSGGGLAVGGLSADRDGSSQGFLAALTAGGRLDKHFGGKGSIRTPGDGGVVSVAHAHGRVIVLATRFTAGGTVSYLRAYRPDGQLDDTFGAGGTVSLRNPASADALRGGLAVGPAGGAVAVLAAPDASLTLARTLPSGKLDARFGLGGFAHTQLASRAREARPLLDARGRVLLAFHATDDQLGVARFDAHGVLDPTFGGRGTGLFLNPGPLADLCCFARGPDGNIIAGGAVVAHARARSFVLRLTDQGRPDPGFGTRGLLLPSGRASRPVLALAAGSNGGLTTAGTLPTVCRFRLDGSRDQGFGVRGCVRPRLPKGITAYVAEALVAGPNRIYVAGAAEARRGHRAAVIALRS